MRNTLQQPVQPQLPPTPFLRTYGEARASGEGHVASLKIAGPYAAEAEAWLEGMVDAVMQTLDARLAEPTDHRSV